MKVVIYKLRDFFLILWNTYGLEFAIAKEAKREVIVVLKTILTNLGVNTVCQN